MVRDLSMSTDVLQAKQQFFAVLALTLLLVLCGSFSSFGQEPNDFIEKGNKLYHDGKFGEAEMTYREGQAAEADPFISGFNLGDALFKQERYEEAASAFQALPSLTDDKKQKAAAYHNLGNSLIKTEKYEESVDAYKQSLRNNPSDLETKYNLAYAKRMLQQQEQQQNQDQNKDDNKENQDKKDQEQKQDKQQDQKDKNKDQQKQENQQQEEQQEKQEPEENKISKEDAERMLDALNQDEKQIRERLDKEKHQKGVRVKIEKDW
ncbi:tetratricopeptide repeat protein [Bacteroidota bacterium]